VGLFVVSGPSGVGKGTVVRRLLQLNPNLTLSISATTRRPRPGEVDGRDYRFVTDDAFDRLIDENAFLEWANVFGHRYGTLADPIRQALAQGRDVILEIDVQGARQVKERGSEATFVFLVPPSDRELAARLRGRHTETEPDMQRRLAMAEEELKAAGWFDHVVVNDDVDRAAAEVAGIIAAEPQDSPGGAPPPDPAAEDAEPVTPRRKKESDS
jgi:guanylate kinase